MEVEQPQRSFIEYTTGLFREGFLDGQFNQLQLLQDESNPDFVDQQNVDFKKIDAHDHQFKGSSSSIGAQRVKNTCIAFRSFWEEQNVQGYVFFHVFRLSFLRKIRDFGAESNETHIQDAHYI